MNELHLTVHGRAQSRGSKRAHRLNDGRIILIDSNRQSRSWIESLRAEAGQAFAGELLRGPVEVHAVFLYARPKSHFGTGRNQCLLKPSAPAQRTQSPDVDKTLRAALDGLTGIVYCDDRQVVRAVAEKCWTTGGERPEITVQWETGESQRVAEK